ncbi:hypothetical protein Sant_1715 [Sodalis praecaptivus]|uniref:Abasic site processing protein n=1 Tax=Sodalis praecaptivus TaxID=1239307 RepID=W0HX80_9GAMM|nr:SOS response-associated peptidase family protein [Sodalis praecaptivus]AHF76768.1 hypothetical protein Sant_1715 [Sodalis praecaptivus]
MCGRFAQFNSREAYLETLNTSPGDMIYDPEPIRCYNVCPGMKVLLLSERHDQLHLDPVFWGYKPEWWDKPPLINARGETAATGRMFKSLWNRGRAVIPADGWYEWKKEGNKKQPYFIYHKAKRPLFFAAIGKEPYDKEHDREGFVIVTASSNKGMVDIHDRRPLVISANRVREWLNRETTSEQAQEIARDAALPECDFTWHPVSKRVGNPYNQGAELVKMINDPEV